MAEHWSGMVQFNAATGVEMRTEHLTAFEFWLHRQLSLQAGTAIAEPLPEEWLSLLLPDEDAGAA